MFGSPVGLPLVDVVGAGKDVWSAEVGREVLPVG